MEKRKTGWDEWCVKRFSIQTGCPYNCRYCFAREMAVRFGRVASANDWVRPILKEKELSRKWTKHEGVLGFPGTHDITPENIHECAGYLFKILAAENRVLIVTKPSSVCIQYLCRYLSKWQGHVEFRFTIGSLDDEIIHYWEPGAPDPDERQRAMQCAVGQGFKVSVSMEPFLDAADVAEVTARQLRAAGAATVWIGKMNDPRRRVICANSKEKERLDQLIRNQADVHILSLVRNLRGEPWVRWKDSIRDVGRRDELPELGIGDKE